MFKKLIFLSLIFPILINAQIENITGKDLITTGCGDIKECIVFYGDKVVTILWILVLIGSIIAILYGAANYLTAGGEKDKVDKAKKYILNGVIAVIVGSLSYLIINAVLGTLAS